MKPLTEEEWKKLQEIVKKLNEIRALLGVIHFTGVIEIEKEEKENDSSQ